MQAQLWEGFLPSFCLANIAKSLVWLYLEPSILIFGNSEVPRFFLEFLLVTFLVFSI
ncbi:hypothetical protein VCSRO90_2611 [Vibrio cholerae]|nr:hypothetical protein VCSRO90_2611 [Vibrio cholerae]